MKKLKIKTSRNMRKSSGHAPEIEISPFVKNYGLIMFDFDMPYGRGTSKFNSQVSTEDFLNWIADDLVPEIKSSDDAIIRLAQVCLEELSRRRLDEG